MVQENLDYFCCIYGHEKIDKSIIVGSLIDRIFSQLEGEYGLPNLSFYILEDYITNQALVGTLKMNLVTYER